MKELGGALNKFAKYVVQQSRTNLTKGAKETLLKDFIILLDIQ